MAPIIGHKRRVNACSFSGDGSMVATAGNDKAVRIWSLDEGLKPPDDGDEEEDDWLFRARFADLPAVEEEEEESTGSMASARSSHPSHVSTGDPSHTCLMIPPTCLMISPTCLLIPPTCLMSYYPCHTCLMIPPKSFDLSHVCPDASHVTSQPPPHPSTDAGGAGGSDLNPKP
jgi:WD40 repeat protein